MIGVDTNVALFACRADSPNHAASSAAVADALRGGLLVVVPQLFQEFISVITRPPPRGAALAPELARDVFDATFGSTLKAPSAEAFAARFRALIAASRPSGARVHDVALAASYLAVGVTELLTFNDHDFVGLGLPTRRP